MNTGNVSKQLVVSGLQILFFLSLSLSFFFFFFLLLGLIHYHNFSETYESSFSSGRLRVGMVRRKEVKGRRRGIYQKYISSEKPLKKHTYLGVSDRNHYNRLGRLLVFSRALHYLVNKVAVSSSIAGLLILFDQTVPLASKFFSLWLGTGFVVRRTFCTELPTSLGSSFSALH